VPRTASCGADVAHREGGAGWLDPWRRGTSGPCSSSSATGSGAPGPSCSRSPSRRSSWSCSGA